ncbi:MAG TPA: hypothetical protein EYG54_04305 [Myxococcales bacterium]|nr:hypothetical protein [Myxococcales bacterium]
MTNSKKPGSVLSSIPRAPDDQTSATTRSAASWESTRTGKRKSAFCILLLVALQASSGCYYTHLARGQTRVLWGRLNIQSVLEDPDTPSMLADHLGVVVQTLAFARQIGLEVDGQYTSYLPWPGDRVITTLVVTEPGQIEALPFRFPLVGAVPYKGFFDTAMAESAADDFRSRGMDVCLVPVRAYSTLGFFDDPVSDPMLAMGEGRLIETLLHELVHSTVFLKSQPNFNEGVASFIGQEASIRFLAGDPPRAARRRQEVTDSRALARFLLAYRTQIRLLYAEASGAEETALRREKAEDEARRELRELPLFTYPSEELANTIALNDACLALRGTYAEEIPRFENVLDNLKGDLPAFIDRLRAAAARENPSESFFAHQSPPDSG